MLRPRALLVDVGFTLTTYDSRRILELIAPHSVAVALSELMAAERSLREELANHSWPMEPKSSSPKDGGVKLFRRMLALSSARGTEKDLTSAAEQLWSAHLEENLMSDVYDGVRGCLEKLQKSKIKMAAVSNSEGTLDVLLERIGLRKFFESTVDSWKVGSAKPDKKIFLAALNTLNVSASEAVMIGDSPIADMSGARAAGIKGALIDPFGLYEDSVHPRFASFVNFAGSIEWDLGP